LTTTTAQRPVSLPWQRASRLLRRIVRECPERASTSPDERRSQEILAEEFASHGLEIDWQPFRGSRSLYAVMGLHMAVAVLGSIVFVWLPLVGAALQLLAAVSYALDCHYRAFWLRSLLGYSPSQNLIARLPASGKLAQRVVLIGHADAAPTGWMFDPLFLRLVMWLSPKWPAFLRKQMFGWIVCLAIMWVLTAIRVTTDWWWIPGWYACLTLASLVPLILFSQIAIMRRIVPGANDNLSGCAALVLLTERFAAQRPENVEIWLVVTGCEESGRGGALALVDKLRGESPAVPTTCIALDTISGGDLKYHYEGEIWPLRLDHHLVAVLEAAALGDDRCQSLGPFHAPAGATDAAPLILGGIPAVCLSRIDARTDLPQNYHVLSDRTGNLCWPDIAATADFTERVVWKLSEGA
jgi:hypothetical protein